MDPLTFAAHAPGTVIPVADKCGAYWAYVPAPLPPALAWDLELVAQLSQADRAVAELAGSIRHLVNPALVIGPLSRQEAVLSSRIEGTQTSLTELYANEARQLVFMDMQAPPSSDDVREVYNYFRALQHGVERLSSLPVSLRLLRELHRILLQGVRGERCAPGNFRQTQNWIGREECTPPEATYVPPPVAQMQDCLNEFEKYLHSPDQTPPLVRMAFIHYQFEAIHPFSDGNGRIGRLILSLLGVEWQLLPQPFLYLSGYFERHRQEYYERLLAVSETGAWREWVCFFLRGVDEQAKITAEKVIRLVTLREDWLGKLTKARASLKLRQLVDCLFELPIITVPRAVQELGLSRTACERHIQHLLNEGILERFGEGAHPREYYAPHLLNIVSQ